ncbi:MAG: SPASM domain-containing protein [bacterium]
MILFGTPTRLRWFFDQRKPDQSLRFAESIAEAKVLELTLRFSSSPGKKHLQELKKLFNNSTTRIIVELGIMALSADTPAILEILEPVRLSLVIHPSDEAPIPHKFLQPFLSNKTPVFLQVEQRRSHLAFLNRVGRDLLKINFGDLIVTNPFLAGPEGREIPPVEDLDAGGEECGEILDLFKGKTTFHHPLVHLLATGGRGAKFHACQAANARASVAWDGIVYPCESFLSPLGSLEKQSLREIWDSSVRRKLAGDLNKTPDSCAGCRNLETCLGGCRGLTHFYRKSIEERDILCRSAFRE